MTLRVVGCSAGSRYYGEDKDRSKDGGAST